MFVFELGEELLIDSTVSIYSNIYHLFGQMLLTFQLEIVLE